MSYYQGYASQRGRGLGNVMGGLFRAAVPWLGNTLKNAAKAAGTSIIQSGLTALDNKRPTHSPKSSSRPTAPKRLTSRKQSLIPRKRNKQVKKTEDIFDRQK